MCTYLFRYDSELDLKETLKSLPICMNQQNAINLLVSVGIVITLITCLLVMSVIASMGLDVSALAISFCVATMVVILGGRKLMATYVSQKIHRQFEALNEEYSELEKHFYQQANAMD